jgi:hypothetical protein
MPGTKEKNIQVVQSNQSKIVSGILMLGGIYITYRLGKKLIDGLSKSDAQAKADDSPEVRQAMALRSAMNPSGVSWMRNFDTTNDSSILDTAKTITKLDSVVGAYKNLYQNNMLDDLQSELTTSDYQKFLNIISANQKKDVNSGGSAPVQYAKANQMVVVKKDVYLRSSPDATNHGRIYEMFSNKNIIRLAKAGEFIGYATGRQAYDEINNVKFIEVAYVINGAKAPANLKSKNKQRINYWVSSSITYVDIFPYFKNMYDAYPKTAPLTAWMKPSDFFTLKGLPMQRLLTKGVTPVLNDQLLTVDYAEPNMVLGQLIMSMDTGNKQFMQFKTLDNTLRWVDGSNIILQQ